MKFRPANLIPLGVTGVVVALAIWAHLTSRQAAELAVTSEQSDRPILEVVEWLSYDLRVRAGAYLNDPNAVSKKLAAVFIDDEALLRLNDGTYAPYLAPANSPEQVDRLRPAPPLPRFIHGQLVRELARQGAKVVAFDVFFSELQETNEMYMVPDPVHGRISSDAFFTQEIRRASNVVLALEKSLWPADYFRTNALAVANVSSHRDKGVLRRAKPFEELRAWHPLILSRVRTMGLLLAQAVTNQPGRILIPIQKNQFDLNPAPFDIPLNANGTLKLTRDLDLDVADDPDDEGPLTEKPFEVQRAWNLGLFMAARELELDLDAAEVRPGRLVLRGPKGLKREIPTDAAGFFQVDWSVRYQDLKSDGTTVYFGRLGEVLIYDKGRQSGAADIPTVFKDKLVLIGSTATGNNMSDTGDTPLEAQTPLVTKHLNIANSILNDRFIERTSPGTEAALITVLGLISALLTWRMRVLAALLAVAGLVATYWAFTFWMYLDYRLWLPQVMPIAGGLILPHFSLVTYRVIFEQREQRRVRGIFSRIVSPDVVQELLSADRLELVGERRNITVFFADVRGFTEFTDSSQEAALEHVRKHHLDEEQARAYFDHVAAEQLATVNLYLATIADIVKVHRGTFDKFMGDCVMAFWGAPIPNEQHALFCVRAAIDAQRALHQLNLQRFAENERRKAENQTRLQENQEPLPLWPILSLGTGINSGYATVGLMGSETTHSNYTVFGREINLASRLEGASGRGRILISEATYLELQKYDPALAAGCVAQAAITPKGFRQPVPNYEVPWKLPAEPKPPAEATAASA